MLFPGAWSGYVQCSISMRKLGIVAIVGGSNAGLLEDSWCWRRSVIELLEAEKRLGGFE